MHGDDDGDHGSSLCRTVTALLSLEEAQRRILDRAQRLPSERVPLAAAAGRVLAEAAAGQVDLPPFDASAMDGFAVRAADTPGRLPVAARIAAGRPAPRALQAGEAMAIATGGAVPEQADAVIPIEYVVEGDNSIEIGEPVEVGANVRPRGGDLRKGETVVAAGTVLGAAQLGALAAAGVADILSARRPRAVVLATGSELRPPGSELRPGEIYEANGVILATQLASAGAEVERLGPVPDDEAAHRAALETGLQADVLVSSGGVSVGPHDLVRSVGAELGVEEVLWGVAVKPGKPLWFGVRGQTLVFGVPGNPVSALVCFELFVRPALLALQGIADPLPRFEPGTLARSVRRNPVRTELVRARSRLAEGAVEVEPVTGQDSHMIARAAGADVLVLVPSGDDELVAGTAVSFLRLV
jgi:molybdopterin molybdotransferase